MERFISEGKSIFDFEVVGTIIKIDNPQKYIGETDGKIICLSNSRPDVILLMKSCLAIVSDDGGLVSHLAIMGKELGVPTIVGAVSAYNKVKDGMIVRLIASEGSGKIYAL